MSRTTIEDNAAIRTQQEVAEMLGITRGGVHMIETNALRKLFVRLRDDPVMQQAWRDLQGECPDGER